MKVPAITLRTESKGPTTNTMAQIRNVMELERDKKLNMQNAFEVDFDNLDMKTWMAE